MAVLQACRLRRSRPAADMAAATATLIQAAWHERFYNCVDVNICLIQLARCL
jgi:hypothetical protein